MKNIFLIGVLLLLLPVTAFGAASVSPNPANLGEQNLTLTPAENGTMTWIYLDPDSNPASPLWRCDMYDTDYPPTPIAGWCFSEDTFNPAEPPWTPGTYSAISYSPTYYCTGLDYQTCLTDPDHGNGVEYRFTILPPPVAPGTQNPLVNFQPNINVMSSLSGTLRGTVEINYLAEDADDSAGKPEFGLSSSSVSFYYKPGSEYTWTLIADGLPPHGKFLWDTTKIPDGMEYQLKAAVIDKASLSYEVVGGKFDIDNTPPTFTITAKPTFSKGESINIDVKSSEALKTDPTLIITQFNHEPVKVPFQNNTFLMTFFAAYKPLQGFDGSAKISIEGEDAAGNVGTIFTGDDSVTIGVQPPPKPVITTPEADLKTNDTVLPVLQGVSATTKKVIVKLNGKEIATLDNLKKGAFKITDIKLNPLFNKGRNIIGVIAEDSSGVRSDVSTREILVNSPPKVKLIEPHGFILRVNGEVRFSWEGTDINNDRLSYSLDLSENGGETWKTLVQNTKKEEFVLDSATVPDGSTYKLRIIVSDGSLAGETVSNPITVVNNLPAIILEASGDVFTSSTSKTLRGAVRSKNDMIAKLELSLDLEKTWQEILPDDDAWNSPFEKFSITLNKSRSLTQKIILRGTSALKRTVLNAQSVRIFFDDVPPTLTTQILPSLLTTRFVTLDGIARDNLAGIKNVEYRFDDSEWFEAPLSEKLGSVRTEFTINHPEPLKDGHHKMDVVVIDRAENVSKTKKFEFDLDATPPRIGSFTIETSSTIIFPNEAGAFKVPFKTQLHFRLAVGGNPAKVTLTLGNTEPKLRFSKESGLWENDFSITETGSTTFAVQAEDTVKNKTQKVLGILSTP